MDIYANWSEASRGAVFLRRLFGHYQSVRGIPRLLRLLRFFVFPHKDVLVDTFHGEPVTINPKDVSQVMLYYFPYSPELRLLMSDTLVTGDTCFDLGCNVGILSVKMAELVGPRGKVVAVDPNPRVCSQLANTKTKLGLHNIEIVQAGVAGHIGTGALIIPEQGFSESVEVSERKDEIGQADNIALVTVDDLVRKFGVPQFVKVDIEGGETYLGESMRHLLQDEDSRPILLIEYHRHKVESRRGNVDSIRKQLTALGYQERLVNRVGTQDYSLVATLPNPIEHENLLYIMSSHLYSRPILRKRWA